MPRAKRIKEEKKSLLQRFGPGWITGAADDDPAGIGTYSYAGSRFGFNVLWTMFFTYPLMTAVQELCARIGEVSGRGLAGILRQHYSKPALYFCVALLLIANTINIGANIGAMASAMQLVAPLPIIVWALLFTALTLFLEIFVSYKTYAKYLKVLTFSLVAYIVTVFIAQPNWFEVIGHTILPVIQFDGEFLFLLVGILGTTISPYLFFWQSSNEVEDEIDKGRTTVTLRKGATKKEVSLMRWDVSIGMLFSNLVAFFVMLTAATVLFPHGVIIGTAQEAAMALEPLAGRFASLIFSVGIICTGLLAVPVLAGSASYAISECFDWEMGLSKKFNEAHGFYGVITIATLVGLLINFIGIDPFRALVWCAVINGIIAPILLTFIMMVGNNKKVMGKWTSGRWSNVLVGTTILVMTASIVLMIAYWR